MLASPARVASRTGQSEEPIRLATTAATRRLLAPTGVRRPWSRAGGRQSDRGTIFRQKLDIRNFGGCRGSKRPPESNQERGGNPRAEPTHSDFSPCSGIHLTERTPTPHPRNAHGPENPRRPFERTRIAPAITGRGRPAPNAPPRQPQHSHSPRPQATSRSISSVWAGLPLCHRWDRSHHEVTYPVSLKHHRFHAHPPDRVGGAEHRLGYGRPQ